MQMIANAPDHLLTLGGLDPAGLESLIALAAELKADPTAHAGALGGRTVLLHFTKPSTRTRVSFEAAVVRLGGHPIFAGPDQLQLGRGEPIADTARVISRYCAAIVIRTHAHADVEEFAVVVVRAGRERPHRHASPVPGAGRPADAARALRLAGRPRGGVRGRRQQRRALADRGVRAVRRARAAGVPRGLPPARRACSPGRRRWPPRPVARSACSTIRPRPSPARTPSTPTCSSRWARRTCARRSSPCSAATRWTRR